jgi:hypothetical protein
VRYVGANSTARDLVANAKTVLIADANSVKKNLKILSLIEKTTSHLI